MTTDIRDLAEAYGTPLYVYRIDRISLAAAELQNSLPEGSVLHYSLKANPHPDIARALRSSGCKAEVSSSGELEAARTAGFSATDCLYTGPAKSAAELAFAIDAGVPRFSVESAADLRRVAAAARAAGVTVDCIVRVNAVAGGATGLRMTGAPTQFGIDLARLPEELAGVRDLDGADIAGLHFFPVSNAKDEDSLLAEFTGSIRAAKRIGTELGLPLRLLDLGGGFGAPYARPGARPHYSRLRTGVEAELDATLPGWRAGEPEIIFESGRYLVADCGELACAVVERKRSGDRRFTLLDGGVNHLGGMAGLGRLLPAARARRTDPDSASRTTFVGPLCTPIDVLGRDVPENPSDDLVVFPNVGAYGLTASLLAFLSRELPAEVVLDGDDIRSVTRLELSRRAVAQADSGL